MHLKKKKKKQLSNIRSCALIFTTTNKRIDPKHQIEWSKEKDRFDCLRISMQQTIMKDEIMGFACILNTMDSDPLRSWKAMSTCIFYEILHYIT